LKIYILTFHCAKNYGATLQAYALKKVLERYTNDVSFINYRPLFLTKRDVLEIPPLLSKIAGNSKCPPVIARLC